MPLEVIDSQDTNTNYIFDVVDFSNRMDTLCENLSDDDNIQASEFVLNVVRSYSVCGDKIPRNLLFKMASDVVTKKDEYPIIVIHTIDFSLSFIMLAMLKKNAPDTDTGDIVSHMNECWMNILNLLRNVPDESPDAE